MYIHSPTSDVNATFALALLVFFLLHAKFLGTSGLNAYKGHYWTNVTGGNPLLIPLKILLNVVSVILNVVNELSRPLTLSFRLFGNILAGEVLLIVWAYLLAPSFRRADHGHLEHNFRGVRHIRWYHSGIHIYGAHRRLHGDRQ